VGYDSEDCRKIVIRLTSASCRMVDQAAAHRCEATLNLN
jgi:hypothetical protein